MAGRLDNLRLGVDPVLTTLARGYNNPVNVGDLLFPIVNVPEQTGKIPIFNKDNFRSIDSRRAIRGKSNEVALGGLTYSSFSTVEHDLAVGIDYLELLASKNVFNIQKRATDVVTAIVNGEREKIIADLATATGTYGSSNKVTLTDDFFNEDAIDCVVKLRDYIYDLKSLIGVDPNLMIIPNKVWGLMKDNAKLKTYLGFSIGGSVIAQNSVSTEALANVLGIERIAIAGALYTLDGTTFVPTWGNSIVIANTVSQKGAAQSEYDPSFGYTFRLNGTPTVDIYDEDNGKKVQMVRYTDNYEAKVVGTDSAFLIDDPIDPAIYAA